MLFFQLKGYRRLVYYRLKNFFLYPYYRLKARQIYNQLARSSSSNWELYVKVKEVENICEAMQSATERKTNLVAALLSLRICLLGFCKDDDEPRELSEEDFLALQKDFAIQRELALAAIDDVADLNGRDTADLRERVASLHPTELIEISEIERIIYAIEEDYNKITYAPLY